MYILIYQISEMKIMMLKSHPNNVAKVIEFLKTVLDYAKQILTSIKTEHPKMVSKDLYLHALSIGQQLKNVLLGNRDRKIQVTLFLLFSVYAYVLSRVTIWNNCHTTTFIALETDLVKERNEDKNPLTGISIVYNDYHVNCGIDSCIAGPLLPYCKVTCEKGIHLIVLIETRCYKTI